jgi:pentapeptide MXKDX repeat protein
MEILMKSAQRFSLLALTLAFLAGAGGMQIAHADDAMMKKDDATAMKKDDGMKKDAMMKSDGKMDKKDTMMKDDSMSKDKMAPASDTMGK